MRQQRVLGAGASGFVGHALCTETVSHGSAVRGITRASGDLPISVENFAVGGIDGSTDPLGEFHWVNVQGTLNLARQAAAAGVRRFVFVSF